MTVVIDVLIQKYFDEFIQVRLENRGGSFVCLFIVYEFR
ncbi:hypothetical protein VCHA37P200_80146 [Vibrio chagasii]|nr:hypothetical protein VCHA34P116_110038 [Vibrio chagasii]CAH6818652.1 hypothetical protein VCHA28FP16_140113 [Vibrio chagasii]CAH6833892.1 hypothetical protein VCHA35O142_10200 [Vibrio chagasii]CAH6836286.1 hypothetical protein VCHA35O137_10149 [Vibrio chagasii]CAH6860175.1 hypothetical protein VCHA32P90_10976 [Vibrio chagasii]